MAGSRCFLTAPFVHKSFSYSVLTTVRGDLILPTKQMDYGCRRREFRNRQRHERRSGQVPDSIEAPGAQESRRCFGTGGKVMPDSWRRWGCTACSGWR
jgi:hypothetical protein